VNIPTFGITVLHNVAEYIHSDVLFGAFFSAMAKISPDQLMASNSIL
jgi:CRISPR/Cas system CSM-associated protein Csm4 (group 5 of RAMP superfamily)